MPSSFRTPCSQLPPSPPHTHLSSLNNIPPPSLPLVLSPWTPTATQPHAEAPTPPAAPPTPSPGCSLPVPLPGSSPLLQVPLPGALSLPDLTRQLGPFSFSGHRKKACETPLLLSATFLSVLCSHFEGHCLQLSSLWLLCSPCGAQRRSNRPATQIRTTKGEATLELPKPTLCLCCAIALLSPYPPVNHF